MPAGPAQSQLECRIRAELGTKCYLCSSDSRMGCVNSSELEPNKDSNFDRATSPQEEKPQIVFERQASEKLTDPIPVVEDTGKDIVEVESIEGKFLSALTLHLF